MDYEKRKQKYLDKLKMTYSYAGTKTNVGIAYSQNDNSLCFNKSHQQSNERNVPNDLLAKVKRYNEANPMSHITKNRLTMKRGLHQQTDFRSNIQKTNYLNTMHKSNNVQNVKNAISFIKSKPTTENYKPDTKFKLDHPNTSSAIKYQQIHSIKNSAIPIIIANTKTNVSENKYLRDSISDCSSLPKIIRSETQRSPFITSMDKELNTNEFSYTNIEEDAKLNLTYCMYLEFVHSHRDAIISINEKVYPNNDYSKNLKKRLQEVKFKYQNTQSVNTISSESTSSNSNFVFKPVISSSYSPEKCASLFSQDSFICSSPQTISTDVMSLDSSLEKSIQQLNDNQESSSESSEISFKYYRRKMF